jgi:hypothetical protein
VPETPPGHALQPAWVALVPCAQVEQVELAVVVPSVQLVEQVVRAVVVPSVQVVGQAALAVVVLSVQDVGQAALAVVVPSVQVVGQVVLAVVVPSVQVVGQVVAVVVVPSVQLVRCTGVGIGVAIDWGCGCGCRPPPEGCVTHNVVAMPMEFPGTWPAGQEPELLFVVLEILVVEFVVGDGPVEEVEMLQA